MELKITKEKVIEAAAKCSDAKVILKTLFPSAFEEEDEETEIALASFINEREDVSYKFYRDIPGFDSRDKAKWIINQVKANKKN